MIDLVSRSIPGTLAGLISLGRAAGRVLAFFAAFGITALALAVPFAYDALRFGGALYLLYLAWQVAKPGATIDHRFVTSPIGLPGRLFTMGLVIAICQMAA